MYKSSRITLFCLLFTVFLSGGFFVSAQTQNTAGSLKTSSESESSRIAPGEFLPVSMKLLNFGSQKRVDVIVTYKISDSSGTQVFSDSETVAVDTTASFIKRIQLPAIMKPGVYTVLTSMKYPYQEDPAISKFQINVENKIAGFFISDLILYSIVIILVIVIAIVLTYFLSVKNRQYSIIYHDYSDKPKDQVVYYEILSDIISEMRLKVGDDALAIAQDIPDLEVNEKNGLVVDIKSDPAKITELLIERYERMFGKKVSFKLRKT